MIPSESTRRLTSASAWSLLLALTSMTVAVVFLRGAAPALTPSTQSEPDQWCSVEGVGFHRAVEVGSLLLGMYSYSESASESAYEDPRWSAACSIAWELWGLSPDEEAWCQEEVNRRTRLTATVGQLGFGASEALGDDPFAEAPGDSPVEYVYACRYAFKHASDGMVDAASNPETDSLFALNQSEADWCLAHPDEVESASEAVGAGGFSGNTSTALTLRDIVGCRLASSVAAAHELPLIAPSALPSLAAPPMVKFRAIYVNNGSEDVRVRETSAFATSGGLVPACSATDGTSAHTLPVELAFSTAGSGDDYIVLHTVDEAAPGSEISVEVIFGAGEQVTVRDVDLTSTDSELRTEEPCG